LIDFWNFVVAVACTAALVVAFLAVRKEERRKTLVSIVSAFIIGLAFHSVLLHEQARQRWRFPWDHNHDENNA